jgi:hypothetical protein
MENHFLSFTTINGLGETIVFDISRHGIDGHVELIIENEDSKLPLENRSQFFILNPKQKDELRKFLEQI